MEGMPRPKAVEDTREQDVKSLSLERLEMLGDEEKIKDYLFDQRLKQLLLEDFVDYLYEYFDDDQVEAMRSELASCDDDDLYAALSLPWELRDQKFQKFAAQLAAGALPENLMSAYIVASARHGFNIGYHTSPQSIRPDSAGHWTINGTENDHRDNDLSRAYYSTKYRHLFKKKNPQFIYIVRTEPTHGSDGNWNRAGKLSVVMQVPFSDVVDYVEETAREALHKEKNGERKNGR